MGLKKDVFKVISRTVRPLRKAADITEEEDLNSCFVSVFLIKDWTGEKSPLERGNGSPGEVKCFYEPGLSVVLGRTDRAIFKDAINLHGVEGLQEGCWTW